MTRRDHWCFQSFVNVFFGPLLICFIVAGAIFRRDVLTESFSPFVDVQNLAYVLDGGHLLGYLPLRFDSPPLLNRQPATKEPVYSRVPWCDGCVCLCWGSGVGWSRHTWERLSTPDVCREVVVSVGCVRRKTWGSCCLDFLLKTRWRQKNWSDDSATRSCVCFFCSDWGSSWWNLICGNLSHPCYFFFHTLFEIRATCRTVGVF